MHAEYLLIVYPDVSVPSCVDSVLARRSCAGPAARCARLLARAAGGGGGPEADGEGPGGCERVTVRGLWMAPACAF